MKKVLIVYKFLPEYRVDFYNQLKNILLEKNIELYVIYGNLNKTDALRKNEVAIEWAQYVPNRRLQIGKKEILWQPCLKYLNGKDLIIVQQEAKLLLNYYLIFARHFSKYKLAFWGHVNNMQDKPNSFTNKLKLIFLRKCDWWFGYTKGAKVFLEKKKYPENKITIVQNAIDTLNLKKHYRTICVNEENELKKRLGITGDNIGIYCGGMYPDKDLDFILQSSLLVKKEIPDFQMLFIGSGIESYKIKEAAQTCNWVHYIGPKFGKDRILYFKISAVQIMPRLVGLCILDSFAMETPLITTDHSFHGPEIDYLKNGVNGIITKDNLNDYSQTIIDTFKNKRYYSLIEGCKLAADKYTVENMAKKFQKWNCIMPKSKMTPPQLANNCI